MSNLSLSCVPCGRDCSKPVTLTASLSSMTYNDFLLNPSLNCGDSEFGCGGTGECGFSGTTGNNAKLAFGLLSSVIGFDLKSNNNPFCLLAQTNSSCDDLYINQIDVEIDSLDCVSNCLTVGLSQKNTRCGTSVSTEIVPMSDVMALKATAFNKLCSTCADFSVPCNPQPQMARATSTTTIQAYECQEEGACCDCNACEQKLKPAQFINRTTHQFVFISPAYMDACCLRINLYDCTTGEVVACSNITQSTQTTDKCGPAYVVTRP